MTAPTPRQPAIDFDGLALALQVADSAFPSGAFTASWGIEGMHASGLVVDAATLELAVRQQVEHRWTTSDRWFVTHGYTASLVTPGGIASLVTPGGIASPVTPGGIASLEVCRLRELDELCEITMNAPAARVASRRAGLAMLSAHCAIDVAGSPAATDRLLTLKTIVGDGELLGHLPVVHGAVFATIGLPIAAAVIASGVQFVQAMCSAALRLGVVGHLDAQRVVSVGRRLVVAACAMPLEESPSANVPDADIAMLAHPARDHRLFSC